MIEEPTGGTVAVGRSSGQPQPAPPRVTLLSDDDLYLFNEGSHYHLYAKLGAHPLVAEGVAGLRDAPGVVDARARRGRAVADVPRAGAAPGRLLPAAWFHARRVPAGDGAPVLRLVGLPDDWLLCADEPLRHAAGLHVPGGLPAPARHRRDPRLGAVA